MYPHPSGPSRTRIRTQFDVTDKAATHKIDLRDDEWSRVVYHSTFSAHQFEQTLAAIVLKLFVARIEEVANSRHYYVY